MGDTAPGDWATTSTGRHQHMPVGVSPPARQPASPPSQPPKRAQPPSPAATAFIAEMPITSPYKLTRGPPELPCNTGQWLITSTLSCLVPATACPPQLASCITDPTTKRGCPALPLPHAPAPAPCPCSHLVDGGICLDVVCAGPRQPQLDSLAVHTAARTEAEQGCNQARQGM